MQRLYQYKQIQYGFIIISPDANQGRVKTTISSLRHNYPEAAILCTTPEDSHPDNVKEIKRLCPCKFGGKTITSLINAGLAEPPCCEWNFVVVAGTWVRGNLDKKFSLFIESNKDILFPIADRKTSFVDGTINGILLHQKTFEEIGPMGSDNPLPICKMMWTLDAIEKGCRFKAILGTAIC